MCVSGRLQTVFRWKDGRKEPIVSAHGRHFLNGKCRMVQWWQQILPIWNAEHWLKGKSVLYFSLICLKIREIVR